MLKDNRAVSTVLSEILMIAVAIIIAALVAAFSYDILYGSLQVSSVNILVDGAKAGSPLVAIVHMGGDAIPNAFSPASEPEHFLNESVFDNLEVRINGALYEGNASLNRGPISKSNFEVGDELALELGPDRQLSVGDSISVVFLPSDQVLRWTVVV
ncbi:MAG TPA: type IV pilin [Desulfobacteria bacterium]|nr:type IV pilin [Desulfobacteria bacterium]